MHQFIKAKTIPFFYAHLPRFHTCTSASIPAFTPTRQATCGDNNGAAAGVTAVTDADCGTGFVYQSSQNAASCAGAVCVAGTTDQATCCVVFSGSQLTDLTFKEASCKLLYSRISTL